MYIICVYMYMFEGKEIEEMKGKTIYSSCKINSSGKFSDTSS